MQRLLLMIFFLGKMGFGFSQNIATKSPITAIYKVTDDEAEKLYRSPYWIGNDLFFHTFVDTFSTNHYSKEATLNGHYLFIKAVDDKLEVMFESFLTISAVPLNNRRDLTIQVRSLGKM